MAISIDWATKVISVPKADMTLVTMVPFEVRELDLDWFRLQLKDLEDDAEGMPFLDTHRHNTEVEIAGVTLARVIEIINGYTVTFEDGQYAVNLVGANSNVSDVVNLNQVSIRAQNSAGLISGTALADGIERALGLMQENYYLDQTSYADYNGAKLLTSGRIRTYSEAGSVGTDSDVLATYLVAATWTGDELDTYEVVKQ
jgi:hypothetical protein